MKLLKEWPTLQAKSKLNITKFWLIRVLTDENGAGWTECEYWQGTNGAHQTARKRAIPTNVGRSNERNSIQQAMLEAQAEFLHQKDKGYSEPGEDTSARFPLPMLALDYTKRPGAIQFPCLGSPKLDGFRCLWNPDLGFWSRQGKRFDETVNLSHLKVNCGDMILDGELILPAGHSFQDTCKAIKKERAETKLLEFHVFDLVDTENPFLARFERLQKLRNLLPDQIHIVEAQPVQQATQVPDLLAHYLEAGYEGLMLRNAKLGGYEVGHRSSNLCKVKNFDTAEFKVVGITDGQGREEGAAILICETPEGRRFNARPRGDYEMRRKMFELGGYHIGKMWTIRHQGYSEDRLPRFPVGIAERID